MTGVAEYAKANPPTVTAIIAVISNTLVKCGMVTTFGGPAPCRPILLMSAGHAGGTGSVAMMWLRHSS